MERRFVAPMQKTVDLRSPHPDELMSQAAVIVDDVNCLRLRRPHVQRRKRHCNDAVSFRVTKFRHSQAFGVFSGASRHPIG